MYLFRRKHTACNAADQEQAEKAASGIGAAVREGSGCHCYSAIVERKQATAQDHMPQVTQVIADIGAKRRSQQRLAEKEQQEWQQRQREEQEHQGSHLRADIMQSG